MQPGPEGDVSSCVAIPWADPGATNGKTTP